MGDDYCRRAILVDYRSYSICIGAEETKQLIWPTLKLAKMTSLPGQILERLDAAFLAVWVTAVFTTLFSSYFLTIHATSELFGFRDHKMFSILFLPVKGVIVLLLVFPLLAGCWDRLEIEERATILGISLDIAKPESPEEEGEIAHIKEPPPSRRRNDSDDCSNCHSRTIAFRPGYGRRSGWGGDQSPIWVIDVAGHTMDDCMANLEQQVADPLFLGHLRLIVISEAIARKGLSDINDFLRRNSEVRRAAWMIVSEGRAAKVMQAAPELERIPTLYLLSTLDNAVSRGKFPSDFLGIFW